MHLCVQVGYGDKGTSGWKAPKSNQCLNVDICLVLISLNHTGTHIAKQFMEATAVSNTGLS